MELLTDIDDDDAAAAAAAAASAQLSSVPLRSSRTPVDTVATPARAPHRRPKSKVNFRQISRQLPGVALLGECRLVLRRCLKTVARSPKTNTRSLRSRKIHKARSRRSPRVSSSHASLDILFVHIKHLTCLVVSQFSSREKFTHSGVLTRT